MKEKDRKWVDKFAMAANYPFEGYVIYAKDVIELLEARDREHKEECIDYLKKLCWSDKDIEYFNKRIFGTIKNEGKVKMNCLHCGKTVWVEKDSNEHIGVFNVFCSSEGENCEDKYAARL